MKKIICYFSILLFISCSGKGSIEKGKKFSLFNKIKIRDNGFEERIIKDDIYELTKKIKIPYYVDKVHQIEADNGILYFNDRRNIYIYKNGKIDTLYSPSKGRGPGEVINIFRFDIREDVIGISGYPDLRLLIHKLNTDSTFLISTHYRGNILIDELYNFYGSHTSDVSNYMFTKFSLKKDNGTIKSDSLFSFGSLFHNQLQSLNMFDFYWDYNDKHDVIVIGFMYAGYYAVFDTKGNLVYMIESIRKPGSLPIIVNRDNMRYVATEGNAILSGLATYGDEIHIYTADVTNENGEIWGALIDVINIKNGKYKFSYIISKPLAWPIELFNNYKMAAITADYHLIIWERRKE